MFWCNVVFGLWLMVLVSAVLSDGETQLIDQCFLVWVSFFLLSVLVPAFGFGFNHSSCSSWRDSTHRSPCCGVVGFFILVLVFSCYFVSAVLKTGPLFSLWLVISRWTTSSWCTTTRARSCTRQRVSWRRTATCCTKRG